MIINNNPPIYVKLGFQFLIIFFICLFIIVSQNILVPFAFAALISMLLLPVVHFLESKHFGKVLSICVALIFAIAFIGGIIYFLSSEIAGFMHDVPSIKRHLHEHMHDIQKWIDIKLKIPFAQQNRYLAEQADNLKSTGTSTISKTFFSISEIAVFIILIPIYSFLLLYYRIHISHFFFSIFKKEYGGNVRKVMDKSKLMIRSYMTGLIIEMAIVATADSIGLLILGIPYAIFFGVFAAVLNIIPYFGLFTATVFTLLVTLTTTDNTGNLVWIIVIFYSIHIVDVNFLMPRIVASRLRINALISILGVVIGGAIAGISGLFLSVPAIAFLKIVCDQVDSLKPWGVLIGDETTYGQKPKKKET